MKSPDDYQLNKLRCDFVASYVLIPTRTHNFRKSLNEWKNLKKNRCTYTPLLFEMSAQFINNNSLLSLSYYHVEAYNFNASLQLSKIIFC